MIYNGVNMEQFVLGVHDKQYWKKKLGFANVNLLIVVVGHLSKLKDPLLVVKAYISMVNQGYLKNSSLLFCGAGSEEKECKALAQNYSQISSKLVTPFKPFTFVQDAAAHSLLFYIVVSTSHCVCFFCQLFFAELCFELLADDHRKH